MWNGREMVVVVVVVECVFKATRKSNRANYFFLSFFFIYYYFFFWEHYLIFSFLCVVFFIGRSFSSSAAVRLHFGELVALIKQEGKEREVVLRSLLVLLLPGSLTPIKTEDI